MEAQENIGMEVADKMAKYSDTGMTTTSVNFPEVSLPSHAGTHRLLHIHRNTPGIMTAINRIFSESSINISAQYLQTNDKVGYVVLDIDSEYSDIALKALKTIEGTLRCRVLF
jgi:D-3-phosphoglycerate dehydrogenase